MHCTNIGPLNFTPFLQNFSCLTAIIKSLSESSSLKTISGPNILCAETTDHGTRPGHRQAFKRRNRSEL
jgi:hypothetical protein